MDNISTQDRDQGVVPDMVSSYGEAVANAVNHQAGREHLGEAAAERVFSEQAEPTPSAIAFQPPDPQAPDPTGFEEGGE